MDPLKCDANPVVQLEDPRRPIETREPSTRRRRLRRAPTSLDGPRLRLVWKPSLDRFQHLRRIAHATVESINYNPVGTVRVGTPWTPWYRVIAGDLSKFPKRGWTSNTRSSSAYSRERTGLRGTTPREISSVERTGTSQLRPESLRPEAATTEDCATSNLCGDVLNDLALATPSSLRSWASVHVMRHVADIGLISSRVWHIRSGPDTTQPATTGL